MLRFDEIIGQPTAVRMLAGLRESNRIPHAMLFHGPQGVGKATIAESFSAALLCERPDDAPCGGCSSCRLLVRRNHPDYLRVGRLTKDEGQKDKTRLVTPFWDR